MDLQRLAGKLRVNAATIAAGLLFISFASDPAGYQYKQVCVLVFCSAPFRGNQGKSRRGAARWLVGLRVRRKPCRGAALRPPAPLLGPLQAAFHRDASGLQQLPQLPWFSCLSVSCSASLFWTCACFCVRKVIESQSLACLGKTQETRRRVL